MSMAAAACRRTQQVHSFTLVQRSTSSMKLQLFACSLASLVSLLSLSAEAQQETLSPDEIQEAVRLCLDERASAKFLQSYVLQTGTGVGTGPLLGYGSTPHARIVFAASTAKKAGRSFGPADVNAGIAHT